MVVLRTTNTMLYADVDAVCGFTVALFSTVKIDWQLHRSLSGFSHVRT